MARKTKTEGELLAELTHVHADKHGLTKRDMLAGWKGKGGRMLTIASYGGGTNSTAEIIECVNRGIPIDLIMFADTGGERPETYEYVRMFSGWLVAMGYSAIVWVQTVDRFGNKKTLESDCLQCHMLPSLAYGYKSCSRKYKIQPQDKYVNNWQPAREAWKCGEKIIKFIGYDAGEKNRAYGKTKEDQKYIYRYPLIEWDIWRDDCEQIIANAGLPQPGKSSCFFCPSMKRHEIMTLSKEHPDLLERALQIERNAELTRIKGLGRDWSWGKFVDYQERQGNTFGECMTWYEANIPCECYDG